MSRQASAAELLEWAQDGDEAAFRRLHDRYRIMIQSRIRDRLDSRLRSKVGIEDITQEVWLAFLHQLDNIYLPNERAFRGLLRHLATCRAHDANRRFLGAKAQDVRRETSLSQEIPTGRPPPEASIGFEDWWESWMQFLSPREREVLLMARQGHGLRDIADSLGLSEKTVRRLLDRALDARPR